MSSRDLSEVNTNGSNHSAMSSQQYYSSGTPIYAEETSAARLSRKAKDNPFFPIGINNELLDEMIDLNGIQFVDQLKDI